MINKCKKYLQKKKNLVSKYFAHEEKWNKCTKRNVVICSICQKYLEKGMVIDENTNKKYTVRILNITKQEVGRCGISLEIRICRL